MGVLLATSLAQPYAIIGFSILQANNLLSVSPPQFQEIQESAPLLNNVSPNKEKLAGNGKRTCFVSIFIC